jgi:hypothetical protein
MAYTWNCRTKYRAARSPNVPANVLGFLVPSASGTFR